MATHDRYLINRLATKVIEVADGSVRAYPGTYSDYLRAKATPTAPPADAVATVPPTSRVAPPSVDQDPAVRRRLAADLREAERQVTAAEDRLRAVETTLSDPSRFQGDLNALSREHATLLEQVEALTTRWAELAEAAEGAA